jgi:hypothetical protein
MSGTAQPLNIIQKVMHSLQQLKVGLKFQIYGPTSLSIVRFWLLKFNPFLMY